VLSAKIGQGRKISAGRHFTVSEPAVLIARNAPKNDNAAGPALDHAFSPGFQPLFKFGKDRSQLEADVGSRLN
jgi:hypothetical protein